MSCRPPAHFLNEPETEGAGMRVIGLDIHRGFAETAAAHVDASQPFQLAVVQSPAPL
jgi:hypothetical protein